MKVTYLHQYFNTLEMAGSTRSFELARRLVEYGHEVNMITSLREASRICSNRWIQTDEGGIRVHWYPVAYSNEMSYRGRVRAFLEFAMRSARRAASIDGDVIFATSTPLTIALPGVYASKKRRIPMVFEVRDLWPEGPIAVGALRNPLAISAARWLERFAYRNSSRVVALSPGMKDGVASTGYPMDQIEVIPNGCDLELFSVDAGTRQAHRSSREWLQGRPMVIYVGTLGLVNGLNYFIRLASSALEIDPEVRFVMVGSGRESENLRRLAKELGVLENNLFMVPTVPKREVPVWLASADISVSFLANIKAIRSYWMDSQNKFFDALAAGKPLAINHAGWQADLLREHNAGLSLNISDVDTAARELIAHVNDKAWLKRAGEASRRLGETLFDRNKLALQLESILKEVTDVR